MPARPRTEDHGRGRSSPLPSSLIPLAGESLPGYLLRLAFRLDLPPARIAELCGLAGRISHGQIQVDQLIRLPPGVAGRFSAVTSLTSGEVAGLTLSRYRRAYPALTARARRGSIASAYTDTWAVSFSSRYCPECLAEDARRPDGPFGGTWKLSWHLPVVFACTTHRRLLEHACPACGSALNSSRHGKATLITRPDAAGLHPHQCRNPDGSAGESQRRRHEPLCGGRLDDPASPRDRLPPDDLDSLLCLQARIGQQLGREPAGGADADAGYFPDLVATIRLLILSWPEGSGLAGSHALASLIDEHASPARRALSPVPDGTGRARPGRRDVNIWGAPGPAAQCGALILAADSVISDSDPATFRDQVQELARAAARTHPVAFRLTRTLDLSPGYRRAIAPRGHGFRHAPVHPRLLPPSRECLFTTEEIPPHLPLKWYDEHLAGFADRIPDPNAWTPRHLRRLVPVKLAEMTAGGTWRQCAEQLGIPAGAATRSVEVLRRQIGNSGLWEEFDDIAEQIARNLDQDRQRVNYASRRRALEHWQIPPAHWNAICTAVYRAGLHIGPQDPAIGTVLAWESVTQAEHLHSPLLTRMRHEGTSRPLTDKIAMFRTPAARTGSRLVILNRIDKYAGLLARQCDDHASTDISLSELLPWETTASEPRGQAPRKGAS
jgi:hypothetical protein